MTIDLLIGSGILMVIVWKALLSSPNVVRLVIDCSPMLFSVFPSALAWGISVGTTPTMSGILHMVALIVDVLAYIEIRVFLELMVRDELLEYRDQTLSNWRWYNPACWIAKLHLTIEKWKEEDEDEPLTVDMERIEAGEKKHA